MSDPIARSPIPPIAPAPPERVDTGWLVSAQRSDSGLTITDCTPLAKVMVRGELDGALAAVLGVGHGRAARTDAGHLVVGTEPWLWLVLAPVGAAAELVDDLRRGAQRTGKLVTVIDLTHGLALVRITGGRSADLLAKVCAVDLSDQVAPQGVAVRTSAAGVVTDLVRDDVSLADSSSQRSYLLGCERSYGQYLFDALLDAGREYRVDVDGFHAPGI